MEHVPFTLIALFVAFAALASVSMSSTARPLHALLGKLVGTGGTLWCGFLLVTSALTVQAVGDRVEVSEDRSGLVAVATTTAGKKAFWIETDRGYRVARETDGGKIIEEVLDPGRTKVVEGAERPHLVTRRSYQPTRFGWSNEVSGPPRWFGIDHDYELHAPARPR